MSYVFGYGSLVSAESAAETLGRPVKRLIPADLKGWRRRWSQARNNKTCEKTFALPDGALPEFVLGLNLERGEDAAGPVNGALVEVETNDLYRLDLREMRYDRVEVTAEIKAVGDLVEHLRPGAGGEEVFTYVAKEENLAVEPPQDSVILASYASAVEAAFEALGPGELERYRATTGPFPVELAEAKLVRDEVPPGNPRAW